MEIFFKKQSFISGIAFTFFIALFGYLLSLVPGFDKIGQLACAIIIAVVYRQLFGYPNEIKSGIQFSSQKILRLAIILYGLKLDMNVVFNEGISLLARDVVIIAFAIFGAIVLAKVFKADDDITLLLGIGTGICGAAAIAALAPIVKSNEEDTAISVGIIALVGTVFAVVYTLFYSLLPISNIGYGVWAGTTLHELAHVAIATSPAGNDAIAIGLLAKLGRVFLIIPVAFIFLYLMRRKNGSNEHRVSFPWFLIGFILMSALNSYVVPNIMSENYSFIISQITTWLLTSAMVGLGLNINLRHLRHKAFKPLIIMLFISMLLSLITYFSCVDF
ncbi:TPA: YeiH family protein [Staphylococcus pseudintermedius]